MQLLLPKRILFNWEKNKQYNEFDYANFIHSQYKDIKDLDLANNVKNPYKN